MVVTDASVSMLPWTTAFKQLEKEGIGAEVKGAGVEMRRFWQNELFLVNV